MLGSNQLSSNIKYQQMARSLFKQILNEQKIQPFLSLQPQNLKIVCKQASQLFHRKLKNKPNQILAFLSSYHQIILGYNNKVANQVINNISIHFILLSSYAMIQSGQLYSAKQILKKSINYIDSTDPDPILLATALNNLCVLRIKDKKYYKSINVLLQTIQIMQIHMKVLKNNKQKGQMMQDSVFLINSYYLLSKCLTKIKQKNHNSFYKQMYSYSSQTGLKKAIKYLGKQSFLTKKFIELTENDIKIQLPLYRQQVQQKSTHQQRLMKQLQKIQQLIVTREPKTTIIKQIIKQPQIPIPPPPIIDQQNLVCQRSRKINDWNVQIQIVKQKKQKMGNVIINCTKGKDTVNLIISQQRMFKLWTQMNLQDVLYQQCNLNNLSPRELIQYCIFDFLFIDDNKNLQIFPRSNSFIVTFTHNLFNKDNLIFLYHIRDKNYRIAICPKQKSITNYLQLQLQQQFIKQLIEIQQQTDPRLFNIYKKLRQQKRKQNNMKQIQQKTINVKNESGIHNFLKTVLTNFEIFLKSVKPDAKQQQILKQQYQFYKFIQKQKQFEHGRFCYIKYLANIRGFQINVQNTFQTHSPQGKIKAKGQILYSCFQFFKEFGIASQVGASKFRVFCQILSKKYDIKSYQDPLTSQDIQIYQHNSINQIKITFKSFLRKMRHHKSFIFPLTACVISINNQIPVGIRLSGYNPLTCYQVGYFIYSYNQCWKLPTKPQPIPQDFINKVMQQYAYKKQYFLVDWLENKGFKDILKLIKIDDKDSFYIEGMTSSFFRIANIIDLLPQ